MDIIQMLSLNELQPIPGSNFKIKVSISRKWNDYIPSYAGQHGLNIIVIDEHEVRMHASIPCNLVDRFNHLLFEGHSYEISNFQVSNYVGKYKCLKDDTHIVFSLLTEVVEVPRLQYGILEEVFEFTDLASIDETHFQDSHCIDVVGVVQSRTCVRSISNRNDEPQTYLDFVITDTMSKVNVTFWEQSAISCNSALNIAALQLLRPIIIIISSCKIILDEYTGETTLYDAPSTRFFINHNNPVVQTLRYRFLQTVGPYSFKN